MKKQTFPPWMHEREMSAGEFLLAIAQLGMSQIAAGRFLGFSERKARRYANGEKAVSAAEAMLLRSMIHRGEAPLVPKRTRKQY